MKKSELELENLRLQNRIDSLCDEIALLKEPLEDKKYDIDLIAEELQRKISQALTLFIEKLKNNFWKISENLAEFRNLFTAGQRYIVIVSTVKHRKGKYLDSALPANPRSV